MIENILVTRELYILFGPRQLTPGQEAGRFGNIKGTTAALRVSPMPELRLGSHGAGCVVAAESSLALLRTICFLLFFVVGPDLSFSNAEMARSILWRCFSSLAIARRMFK